MAAVETEFDLVEVGIDGRVEITGPLTEGPKGTPPSPPMPRVALPFGLPPVLSSLQSMVEENLQHPEKLPIHDTQRSQRFWPRSMLPENLFSCDLCPVQTTIHVERDPASGKLLGFKEDFIPDTRITPQNSLSMRRPPDPDAQDLRGSGANYPFWPGGLEEPSLENLDFGGTPDKTLFEDLLTTPPGFQAGMTFDEKSSKENREVQTNGSSPSEPIPSVINLADILAQGDEDFGFDDEKVSEESTSQQVNGESPVPGLKRSESLEKLTENEVTVLPPVATRPKEESPRLEWAVKIDINKPVDDFYKRIPVMARRWPFELDTFQKQAVLHLEQHDCVFVAAHTSAGKTVVAEYATALSLRHLTKTVYTSPIKALSNQKFREFRNAFGDENVGLVTGDVQLNQTAACLIMTTEILRSMLYNGSDVIRDLEWVVFDEVHYINDAERGVVWEEVLIMLPQHVNIILLSATVPNTLEFADWIGRTKQKKIYVISTLKRPVPLEHFLYTGNSTKTSNELFLLVDSKGSFLTQGYMKAVAAKKERASKSSQNFGPKGTRGGHPQQDKNTWISLIDMLRKKDKLPVVTFVFSKKKIDENASLLQGVDLTTQSEKSRVHIFFHRCISRLKGNDRELPQVRKMEDMLKRGLGVHHSGILPILKEVVEMLFQENLVKVLFATETFAMGVNMPARTVVFDTIRKHDGKGFRNLLPGEYIQMAGRAGRRGLDTTGTVIILCKGDVPETAELHKTMLGKPTRLESQFRLTYSMILNLLRVEQLRVEDMMKRSFSEFHTQKEKPKRRADMEALRGRVADMKTIECYLCCEDLEQYYRACQEYQSQRRRLQSIMLTHPTALKAMSPGRVVIVNTDRVNNVLGVLLATTLLPNKERDFTVLTMCEKPDSSQDTTELNKNSEKAQNVVTPVLKQQLFMPEGPCWHSLDVLKAANIIVITTTTIKVEPDKIINDVKKREIPRFREDPPGKSVSIATQELLRIVESNPDGLEGLDAVRDLNIRDIELVEQFRALRLQQDTFDQFHCIHCSKFMEHFSQMRENMAVKEELHRLQFLLSDASLSLLPEYNQRLQVLKELKYVDSHGSVELKGRVACEVSSHELMITELVFENILTDLHPTDIAALLSCFVFQQKRCSAPTLTQTLEKGQKDILRIKENIEKLQRTVGLQTTAGADSLDQCYFGLMEVVFEWARGMPFSEITQLTDVQEGIIVRSIQRLHEILRDVKGAARIIGDPVLYQKMAEAETLIKRDIVFAASLYTQ